MGSRFPNLHGKHQTPNQVAPSVEQADNIDRRHNLYEGRTIQYSVLFLVALALPLWNTKGCRDWARTRQLGSPQHPLEDRKMMTATEATPPEELNASMRGLPENYLPLGYHQRDQRPPEPGFPLKGHPPSGGTRGMLGPP